ncbi:unnamed protein product [Ectocarpus sp. CCAP 1310/34]|nr:unnamed protein product [Ectocarpus sp. CCAP 1310/34]
MVTLLVGTTLALAAGVAAGIPLRNDLGNMSMAIDTSSSLARRYFNQGLRFTSTFKFDYAAESQLAALDEDPACAMCEWGLALAYGQNLNDALVMSLEPWFLANEPLAFQAVQRAKALLLSAESEAERSRGGEEGGEEEEEEEEDAGAATSAHGSGDEEDAPDSRRGGGESSTRPSPSSSTAMRRRDLALVSALSLKFVATLEEYESHFVDGLPASLNQAYAEAMADAAARSEEEGWPDHPIVLLLAADAWMNISPWDYWETPSVMRPNARKARTLLEDAMLLDPDNPWAIHFYTHLMEVGAEAGAAVAPAQRLEYLVPGAPHLQHMQSHVEFRTGRWHDASEANLRAVALPDSDASYPDHNMDMLMWALGVEGRRTESGNIGRRLTAYSTARVLAGVAAPLIPPERFLAQEPLHLCAFADWEGVLALAPPPDRAEFPVAAYHFARSFAFANAKDWDSYRREQGLITAGVEIMESRTEYYGVYNAAELTRILDLLSRAEGLRGGIHGTSAGTTPGDVATGATPPGAAAAGPEELELLRQAVEMQDALGYDEPPQLPVPTRLFLAAALLRGVDSGVGGVGIEGGVDGSGGGDGDTATATAPVSVAAPPTLTTPTTTAAAAVAVEEAEAVLLEVDAEYPGMGRTLLGLWRCREALGKHDEALALRERFLASWGPYSEVWLEDSAHVGGVLGGGDGGGGGSGGGGPVVGAGLDEEGGLHHHAPQGVDGKDYHVLAGLTVAAAALSLSAFLLAAARRRSGGGCGGGVFRALLPRGPGGSGAGAEAVSIVVPGGGQGRRGRGRSDKGNGTGGHGYRAIGEGSGDDGSVVQIDGGIL